ncbi:DUF229 domain-containing protein [Candidatus Poribacteria bacterium]|nr:DUF229 domain-containing protein [Candidatus Poribacteria bacterium]
MNILNELKVNIGISALVGLIGGILLGVRNSITAILDHAPHPFPFSKMLSFSLYPIALYALIGCLGMTVIGILIIMLVRVGGYTINRNQVAGLYVGVFVALVLSVVGSNIAGLTTIKENPSTVIEISLISILCGVAFGGLTIYILDKTRKNRLIALCLSLSISLLVFSYGVAWMNMNLLPGFWKPVSLLSDVGLFWLISLLALALYLLFLSVLQRDKPEAKIERIGAFSSLGVVAFVFIIVSLIVYFSGNNVKSLEVKNALVSNEKKTLADLKDKPNILWIVMDAVRADSLSCYGYHRKTTPNIDRMSSEGVLFENAISASPWTLPSHASLFTGMYPDKHGTDAEHRYLTDNFYTIAELLQSYGYKTFGYSNNPWVGPDTNLHQGFDIYEVNEEGPVHSPLVNVAMRRIPNPIGAEDAGARQTNELVEKWIANCYNAKMPFFIFINYMEAHDPYGNTPYFRRYLDANISTAKAKGVNQNPVDYISGNVKMSHEDFEILRTLYDGDISYLDVKMNQLLDYLRQLNIMDNTVLIITSDHGESFGEHHLMSHMLGVYDTLLHVPLVIRYPKLFKAGSRVVRQVRTIDIFPTILDILGINWSGAEELQGRTLVQETQQRELPFAIAEQEILQDVLNELIKANPSFDISTYSRRLKAIRTNKYKYIWASDGRDEFYNIREDTGELNNLNKNSARKSAGIKNVFEAY